MKVPRHQSGNEAAPERITRKRVRASLDAAEPHFRECAVVVAQMTTGQRAENAGRAILDFQPRLFDAIEALESTYRSIKQEERHLITRKRALKQEWFCRRMATLASYSKIVRDGIAVGRAIGDAFAWFFYQRDRNLIAEHLKHQKQLLLPPKIGRLGERVTVTRMQGLAGHLVLYHGTTTFLRMGDISLIDLKTARVKCVAELKTQRLDEMSLEIRATFVAGSRDDLPAPPKTIQLRDPKAPAPMPPTPAMNERHKRQLRLLGEAISRTREASPPPKEIRSEFYFAALEEAVCRANTRTFEYVQAGPGLLIAALRIGKDSLGATLTHAGPAIERATAQAPQSAIKIILPNSKDNAILLGDLGLADHCVTDRNPPLLAWAVDHKVLRQILFSDVFVVTFFNPAHLLKELRGRGFEIDDDLPRAVHAKRRQGGRVFELGNLQYYFSLVQHALMSETSVIAMIDQMLDHTIEEANRVGSVRMMMRPMIRF